MLSDTRRALEESIAHWKLVTKDPLGKSTGGQDCALCQEFRDACHKCPVGISTGNSDCFETPYQVFQSAKRATRRFPQNAEAVKRLRRLAAAEVNFLKSLREE